MSGMKYFVSAGLAALVTAVVAEDARAQFCKPGPNGFGELCVRNGSPMGGSAPSRRPGRNLKFPGQASNFRQQTTRSIVAPAPLQYEMKFMPGENSSLSWNTTVDIDKKPILVYVFDHEQTAGDDYNYSKHIERTVFQDEKVREVSRQFICEKVSVSEGSLLQEVEGREPVLNYLKNLPEARTHIAMLDSHGQLLGTFESEADLRNGAFRREMTNSLKENQRRTVQ